MAPRPRRVPATRSKDNGASPGGKAKSSWRPTGRRSRRRRTIPGPRRRPPGGGPAKASPRGQDLTGRAVARVRSQGAGKGSDSRPLARGRLPTAQVTEDGILPGRGEVGGE